MDKNLEIEYLEKGIKGPYYLLFLILLVDRLIPYLLALRERKIRKW